MESNVAGFWTYNKIFSQQVVIFERVTVETVFKQHQPVSGPLRHMANTLFKPAFCASPAAMILISMHVYLSRGAL